MGRNQTEKNQNSKAGSQKSEQEVDVLYQRIGDRWYAFSLVDDEVFMGSIPSDAIDEGALNGKFHVK